MLSFQYIPSPNFDKRQRDIDTLVLHYTGMPTPQSAIKRMCDPLAKVSAHYVVLENAEILQLVKDKHRAWHAGESKWRNQSALNDNSIGIEIVNKGHEFGYTEFPEPQINSVILLCQELIKRHNIPQHLILGHSDIAPTRKQDPGEFFNWQRLAQHNIGLWTEDFLPAQRPVSQMLEEIGYDALDLKAALIAFQRRFYPQALLNNGSKTFERLSSVSALYQKYKQTRHDI